MKFGADKIGIQQAGHRSMFIAIGEKSGLYKD